MKLSKEAKKQLRSALELSVSCLSDDIDFIGDIMDENITEYLTKDQDLLKYICPDRNREKLILYVGGSLHKEPARIPVEELLRQDLKPESIADMYEHDKDMIEENRVLYKRLLTELMEKIDMAHEKAKKIKIKRR